MEAKRKFAEYVRSRKGWNCTVVDGFNEYELGDENRLSSVTFYQPKDTAAEVSKTDTESAVEEFTSEARLDSLREKLVDMPGLFSQVLGHTSHAVKEDISPEKLVKIMNLVADLEKNILNLGSVVTEEDRSTDNSQQTSEYSHAKTYENHE